MKIFIKLISLLMALLTAASFMVACKDTEGETPPPAAPDPALYDLTGFTIVRENSSSASISMAVSDLNDALKSKVGLDLPVVNDIDKEAGSKEILVGETDRMESTVTVAQLRKKNDKNSWAIRIASDKIVITGTDPASTSRAVATFVRNYVNASSVEGAINISNGVEMSGAYDSVITTQDGTELMVETRAKALLLARRYEVNGETFIASGGSYPGITKLQYQSDPKNNGKLIAISALQLATGDPYNSSCVMLSEDDGKSWNVIARPTQKTLVGIGYGSMANIYELPTQVGDLPAGTLIYSYNIVNYDATKGISIIALWCSFDAGYTWEEYSMIDEAGGIQEGVWEPFMVYCEEDGYLYCFYSDDSDPAHDQKIVYKRTKDGKKWEGKNGMIGQLPTGKDVEPVDVIASSNQEHRPGMPVITKMGNGEYFMAYEYIDENDKCVIRYRTTKNLADWGDPDDSGTLIGMWSAPSCAWLDAGGENGMLFVAAKGGSNNGYMMVSFNYGKTWEKIDDPHASTPIATTSDRVGYSGFMFVADGGKTLYYVNAINDPADKTKRTIGFVKMYVFER